MENERVKILVLDDEDVVLESVSRILKDEHFQVKTVGSGSDALALLNKEPFEILLTDVKMPDMDGLAVMRELADRHPNLKIIVMTAYGSIDNAIESMQLAASDYIRKPFTPDELVAAVNKVVNKHTGSTNRAYLEKQSQDIAAKITSTLSLKEVLDAATKGLTTLLKSKAASLSLLSKSKTTLQTVSSFGLGRVYLGKGSLDAAQSIPLAISKKEVVFVPDVETDSSIQYPAEALREGIRSILSIPLVLENESIGSLRAYSHTSTPYSDLQLEYARRLADLVALCIRNAKTYNDVKEQYDSLRDELWDVFDKVGWE